MSGLSLHIGGTGSAAVGVPASSPFSTAPSPKTVQEAAYGSGSGLAAAPGRGLFPNDATGIAFWSGVAGVAFLMFIRHSLPR